jgi:hypothetical protein
MPYLLFQCVGEWHKIWEKKVLIVHRYATRALRFMDAYRKGLNGKQAAWAAKKYHGHRVIPETILRELEAADIS